MCVYILVSECMCTDVCTCIHVIMNTSVRMNVEVSRRCCILSELELGAFKGHPAWYMGAGIWALVLMIAQQVSELLSQFSGSSLTFYWGLNWIYRLLLAIQPFFTIWTLLTHEHARPFHLIVGSASTSLFRAFKGFVVKVFCYSVIPRHFQMLLGIGFHLLNFVLSTFIIGLQKSYWFLHGNSAACCFLKGSSSRSF